MFVMYTNKYLHTYLLECTCFVFFLFMCLLLFFQVLVIVDAKPKALRLPTDAYYAVEEVHDVSIICNFWGHLCYMKL